MRPGLSTADNRTLSLNDDRLAMREALLQQPRHSGESTAGSGADHGSINAALHLLEDFLGCGLVVVFGVGGVLELRSHERARDGGGQFARACDRAVYALGLRSAIHLGAEGAHDHDLLL